MIQPFISGDRYTIVRKIPASFSKLNDLVKISLHLCKDDSLIMKD
jgi:hypothetical protein